MHTTHARARGGVALAAMGVVGSGLVWFNGLLAVRNSYSGIDLCHDAARNSPPVWSAIPGGYGESGPAVDVEYAVFPFGLNCDFGTVTVYTDLGTPALLVTVAIIAVGLYLRLAPYDADAAAERALYRRLVAAARKRDKSLRRSSEWPPGGQVMS